MKKEQFRIQGLSGTKTLSGTLTIAGAKNAVLPMMAATFLFKDRLTVSNIPDIEDVSRMCEMLEALGAKVERGGRHELTLDTRGTKETALPSAISKRMRASVILTGPMLARLGAVSLPHPGGCVIGARPIDLFLEGFRAMEARVRQKGGRYHITAPKGGLRGADIFFPLISVTATETFMMAAVLARGKTVLRNAAMEPEISDIAAFLNRCGARIKGAGTPTIEITGTPLLRARERTYRTLPDRIETGSFLILAALAGDEVAITNCRPEHVTILTDFLKRAGVPVRIGKNRITVSGNGRIPNKRFTSFTIRTHEYPEFPTDLQAPAVVFLTQASGEGVVFETIFETRLNYTKDLVTMGADITVWDAHRATVRGPRQLRGRELEGPDIRAGLAMLIAATVAKGESVINNAYYIDRGYERIEERLRNIGLAIERVTS